ncbi:DUF4377 domain-containing protein [Shewanella gaetbuli]
MKHNIILLIALIALVGCSDSNQQQDELVSKETWVLSGMPEVCNGIAVYFCPRYSILGSSESNLAYDQIEGYNHQWGAIDTIEVSKYSIDNPPEDGSVFSYKLLTVFNRENVPLGTVYHYNDIPFNGQTFFLKNDKYYLLGYEVDCQTANICVELLNFAEQDVHLNLEIKVTDSGEIIRWY